MPDGLLIAAFDFSTAQADEFHDWYDLEHLPERRAVPGFSACERWIGDESPALAVATYDLDTIGVMHSDAYKAIAYDNVSVWSKRIAAKCTRLLRFQGVQVRSGQCGRARRRRSASAQCHECCAGGREGVQRLVR